jgi:hypothetical protein
MFLAPHAFEGFYGAGDGTATEPLCVARRKSEESPIVAVFLDTLRAAASQIRAQMEV